MVSKTVQLELKYIKKRKAKIEKFKKAHDKFYKEFLNAKTDAQWKRASDKIKRNGEKSREFIRKSQRLLLQQKFTELSKLF